MLPESPLGPVVWLGARYGVQFRPVERVPVVIAVGAAQYVLMEVVLLRRQSHPA